MFCDVVVLLHVNCYCCSEDNEEDRNVDEDADADEDPPEQEAPEPQTRKEFRLLRGTYSNTAKLSSEFLSDRRLQLRVRMVIDASEELHDEYVHDLKCHQEGHESMAYWAGERAGGKWWTSTVVGTFRRFHSSLTIKRLDLTLPVDKPIPHTCTEPWYLEEAERITMFYNLLVDLCANRTWSQSFLTVSFPHIVASVFAKSADAKRRASNLMRALHAGITKLQTMVTNPECKGQLRQLLDDLATHQWPLTKEIFDIGIACNWNAEEFDLKQITVLYIYPFLLVFDLQTFLLSG